MGRGEVPTLGGTSATKVKEFDQYFAGKCL